MARRNYWRRYYRRYYRNKYSSFGKTKMTRNFKASANNMTQGGTFNISVRFEDFVALSSQKSNWKPIDVAGKIAASDMHTYLSNVFDQYRIEKLTIRLKPLGETAANLTNPCILFTAMDRTGFNANITLDQIRTYGSYKESMVSGSKDISPTHVCYIGQSNLVEWSTYTDSKNKASFPDIIWGISYAANASNNSYVSVEIDAMVRYRGVEPEPVPAIDYITNVVLLINNGTNKYPLTYIWLDAPQTLTLDPYCYYVRIKEFAENSDMVDVYVVATTSSSRTVDFAANSYVFGGITALTQTDFNNWSAVGTKESDEISDVMVPTQSSTSSGYTLKWCQFFIQKSGLSPTVFPNLFAQ